MSCRVDVSLLKRRSLRLFINAFFPCTRKVNRKRQTKLRKCVRVARMNDPWDGARSRERETANAHTYTHSAHRVSIVQSTKRINTSCIRRHTLVHVCCGSMPDNCVCVCVRSAQEPTGTSSQWAGPNSFVYWCNGEMETKREHNEAMRVCVCALCVPKWTSTNTIACAEHKHMQTLLYNSIFIVGPQCTTNSSKMISFSSCFALPLLWALVRSNSAWSERENNILLIFCRRKRTDATDLSLEKMKISSIHTRARAHTDIVWAHTVERMRRGAQFRCEASSIRCSCVWSKYIRNVRLNDLSPI